MATNAFWNRILTNTKLARDVVFGDIKFNSNDVDVLGYPLHVFDIQGSNTVKWVAIEINRGDYHLQELKDKGLIKDGDTVLDLGTNVGLTAITVAKVFPKVRVIGVEPSPWNYMAAIANIERNGVADRVTVLNAALSSNSSSILKLRQGVSNSGSTATNSEFPVEGVATTVEVQTITVEEILQAFNIDKVAFIKLDCEGCEYDIVPKLSPRALKIFEDAIMFGEVHSDRMTITPEVTKFVHDLYDGYTSWKLQGKPWKP